MNFTSFRARLTVLGLAALSTGAVVAAQGGGQKPGGAPMIIDFTAVGADGKPVEGLTPADVTVRVGGKNRTVTSLELKKVSAGAAPAAAPAAGAPAPAGDIAPPFSTNEPTAAPSAAAPGGSVNRTVLIIIDTDSLPPASESALKTAISTLLEGLAPSDRVALATAPRDTAQIGFGPASRVRTALATVKGERPASVSSGDALCRTSQTLALLTSMIQPLAANNTPTTVVFIAGSLSVVGSGTGSSGSCEVVQGDYQRVADTAAESRANILVVQGDSAAQGRSDGLEQLAGITGAGSVARVTGEGIAARVLGPSAAYWVATLAPDPTDRPGQAQRLEVKAVKEGITISSRALAAPSRTAMATPGAAAAAPKGNVSTKDMIASPAQFTDLQLRGYAFVQRGAADKMNVFVQVEPVDPSVKLSAVRFGYFDSTNKGGALDAPKIGAYPVTTILPLAPGQYRVRMAATDASGKSGAVDVNVNANLASAGTLKISGLLLGVPENPGGMKPVLTFGTEENLIAFLELYGQFTASIGVKFEVAKSDTGPAMDTYPPAGGGATNEPDKLQVFGQVPIAKLAPGDYVIRAVVEVEGKPVGSTTRTFRKVAK